MGPIRYATSIRARAGSTRRPIVIVAEPKKEQDLALGRVALVVWRDPDHEDHEAKRRWAGRRFDPETVNVDDTNKAAASTP